MLLKDIIESLKNPLEFDSIVSIEKKEIIKILEAARWAPSALNQQVFKFLAVDDDKKKDLVIQSIEEHDSRLTSTLHEIKKPVLRPSFEFSTENYNAKTDKYKDYIWKPHKDDFECANSASFFVLCFHSHLFSGKTFGLTDMGAAIVNMLIEAKNLGYGMRWIRNFNKESLRKRFELPEWLIIDAILAFGKPKIESEKKECDNKQIKDYYFYNTWGNEIEISKFNINGNDFQEYDVESVDAILDRRSIRKYVEDKAVPKGIMLELIKAGMMIPLTINKPYIKLILIDDKEILSQISKNARIVIEQGHMRQAPLIFVVTYDCSNNSPAFYAEIDTGAIIQSILLRAHTLGIGSCWIGAFSRKNVREILKVPEEWHLPSLAICGYPNKYPKPTPRKDLGKIAYYNSWRKKIEKGQFKIFPRYHYASVGLRKLLITRVETPLRERKVGIPKGIPEFEKFL